MTRLLFTVPVSNTKLERMFSKLKRVKINFCCSLDVKRLWKILRIMEEGGNWETFDSMSAMKKLSTDKAWWATEEKGPRCCKSRNFATVNVKSLSDDASYDKKENISENGDKIRYLFSSDAE